MRCFPLIYLSLLLGLAIGCCVGVKSMLGAVGGNAWLALAGGMAASAALCGSGIALANRLAVFWLLRIYGFVLDWLRDAKADKVVNVDKLTYAGNLKTLASLDGDARHVFSQTDICDRAALGRPPNTP